MPRYVEHRNISLCHELKHKLNCSRMPHFQCSLLQRIKSQLSAQHEEVKRMGDEEARERQSLSTQSKNLQLQVCFIFFLYLFQY